MNSVELIVKNPKLTAITNDTTSYEIKGKMKLKRYFYKKNPKEQLIKSYKIKTQIRNFEKYDFVQNRK